MELEKLLTLIKTISDSSLKSFTLEEGNIKIAIENQPYGQMISSEEMSMIREKTKSSESSLNIESGRTLEVNHNECGKFVKSPLVGTFYSSPSPDADSFVSVGDKVKKGQILGIIEAMKLMNEIECDFDGEVEEIFIKNEETVEYGQPLFKIK